VQTPTGSFRNTFYPDVTDAEWDDWHWQLQQAVRDRAALERFLTLSEDEVAFFDRAEKPFPVSIPPHYLSLMHLEDGSDPLRLAMVPRQQEHVTHPGERLDPLGETDHNPVSRIVHTYPHKVLFLVTDFCATYCRYCTRARSVGSGDWPTLERDWQEALDYIRTHPEIKDVLISGGDPLTLSDARLDMLLSALRNIPHVELIRIGTKLPAVLPQRITPELVAMLASHGPLWLSVHYTHVRELHPAARAACDRLANAGIPMMSQTVLLKGVNDSVEAIRELNETLLLCRVKPYYLHMCDPIVGSDHFKVPLSVGQDIIRGLHGHCTGYAVPMLMIDAPGGGGKVPVGPHYIEGREGDRLVLKNYVGDRYFYHDPL
jgi:lysine 2,3-aminomutase